MGSSAKTARTAARAGRAHRGLEARLARFAAPLLFAASFLTAALAGPPCFAQTNEEIVAARQAFNEGKELEKRNQWAEALERFKKVARVKMTPQVRFHIALCEQNLGRLVSAMKGFELAAEEARQAGATAVEVAEHAPARAEALRKRIGSLTIEVTGAAAGATVLLDGVKVAPSSLGAAIPVDPGAHVVEALEPSGKSAARKEVTVAEQGTAQVSLEIEAPRPPPPPPPARPATRPAPTRSRLPAYITGGAGLLVLAGAGVFYGLEVYAINTVRLEAGCDAADHNCSSAYKSIADEGRAYSIVANVSLGVGLATLATAGVLWFALAPKKPGPPGAAITVGPAGRGVAIHGVF